MQGTLHHTLLKVELYSATLLERQNSCLFMKQACNSTISNKYVLCISVLKILNYDSVKVLHSICQQIWKTQQWPQGWKRSVFIPIPKKGNAKECSNYHTIALILHASKVILKILQVRLQQYMNHEHPDFKLDLEKAEEPQIIANSCWIIQKAREFQKKHLFLLYWLCQSLGLCGSQQTVDNS